MKLMDVSFYLAVTSDIDPDQIPDDKYSMGCWMSTFLLAMALEIISFIHPQYLVEIELIFASRLAMVPVMTWPQHPLPSIYDVMKI